MPLSKRLSAKKEERHGRREAFSVGTKMTGRRAEHVTKEDPMSAYQCAFACMTEIQAQLSPKKLSAKLDGLSQPLPSAYTTVSASKRKNAAANRYSNVLPFDYNCVKIQPPAGSLVKGTYINASVVKVRISE